MHDHRLPAIFVADSVGLDFLNTVATPLDKQVDWIDGGDGLLSWLEQASLVPPEAIKALSAQALPGEFDAVASQARKLREWFRAFVVARIGRKLGAVDLRELELLNYLLARDERFDQIVAGAKGKVSVLELRTMRHWRSAESLLLPIGQELAKLVCEEDFRFVKSCEGSSCTLLFADRTRGRARRWCSMAICGNRAKQIAHRERRKANS
jgi:predicted RNA-binding Zn ribbon-like protein